MGINKIRNILDHRIDREISWLQHRMSMLATFQGLLFASFGIIISGENIILAEKIQFILLLTITFIGILISIGTIFGLLASGNVINSINIEWETMVSKKDRKNYPSLRPLVKQRFKGLVTSWLPPISFIAAWLVILLSIIFNKG